MVLPYFLQLYNNEQGINGFQYLIGFFPFIDIVAEIDFGDMLLLKMFMLDIYVKTNSCIWNFIHNHVNLSLISCSFTKAIFHLIFFYYWLNYFIQWSAILFFFLFYTPLSLTISHSFSTSFSTSSSLILFNIFTSDSPLALATNDFDIFPMWF